MRRIKAPRRLARCGYCGHLKAEGAEQPGPQSYIPPDSKDDNALHMALDLIRGIAHNPAYPPNPKTAVSDIE